MSQRTMGENATSTEESTEAIPGDEPAAPVSAVEAYEKEIRDRLSSGPSDPGRPARRRKGAILLALATVATVVIYLQRQERRAEERQEEAARYVEAARNGLARDTRGAYAASAEALRAALAFDPARDDAKAMLAQALAHLAVDYGSGAADRDEALRLAQEVDPAHSPALEARYLLGQGEAGREAEEALIARAAEDASAAVQSLAGAILLGRGDSAQAIERFNAAMQAMPGHVPTLVRIGDYYRSRREHGEALRYYDLALAVAEDHIGALLGAAESRLALRSEPKLLEASVADLARIREETSVPVALREKRRLIEAELHLALGDRETAREKLEALPLELPPPALAVPIVRAFIRAGAPDRAALRFAEFTAAGEAEAQHREAWVRVLLARQEFLRATAVPSAAGERQLRVLQGIAWFELEEYGRAQKTLRSARRAGKLPVEAIIHLAWIDWRQGRRGRALETLERFGWGERARSSGAVAYAEALWDRGEGEKAERVLARAIEEDPHDARLRFALGRVALREGRFAEATEAMEATLEQNPYHTRARAALAARLVEAGEIEAARTHFEHLREQLPESGGALGGLALVEWREGDREAALRMAASALETAPKEAYPLEVRARMYLEEGIPTQAERLLSRAVALRPANAWLWWDLGSLRLELGDHRGAMAAFRRAGREWRGWGFARIGVARALTAAGKAVTASRDLRAYLGAATDRAPLERAWAHAALGEALLAQGKGFATSARAEAMRALELREDLPLARLVAASASDALGDTAAAASHHERAAELAPYLPSTVLAKARHLRDTGSVAFAAEAFERYLELAPRGPGLREAKRALRNLGD